MDSKKKTTIEQEETGESPEGDTKHRIRTHSGGIYDSEKKEKERYIKMAVATSSANGLLVQSSLDQRLGIKTKENIKAMAISESLIFIGTEEGQLHSVISLTVNNNNNNNNTTR